MQTQSEPGRERIVIIDIARLIGMALVYYGHLIEQIMYLKNPAAAAHYKFIYSFHMILFFVLAGSVIGEKRVLAGFGKFLKYRLSSRLIPYFFFSLILAISTLFFTGWFPLTDLSTPDGYIKGIVDTLKGLPAFNIPLWFMALLIMVEIFHFVMFRFLKSNTRILILAVVCYLGGYYLNLKVNFFEAKLLFWFINEVPVVYAFYLFGVFLRRSTLLTRDFSSWKTALASIICLAIVFLTYNLNDGPFRILQAVVILVSGHGNAFWFPVTAVTGSIMVLLFAGLVPQWRILQFMGENVLLLFCLHGVFYHYINAPLAGWMVKALPGSGWIVFLFGTVVVLASLSLCIPFVYFFKKYLPQLTGRPSAEGPILGRLVTT